MPIQPDAGKKKQPANKKFWRDYIYSLLARLSAFAARKSRQATLTLLQSTIGAIFPRPAERGHMPKTQAWK